jgi:hypothetical protein
MKSLPHVEEREARNGKSWDKLEALYPGRKRNVILSSHKK